MVKNSSRSKGIFIKRADYIMPAKNDNNYLSSNECIIRKHVGTIGTERSKNSGKCTQCLKSNVSRSKRTRDILSKLGL